MFSRRTSWSVGLNRIGAAWDECRRSGRPVLDLTETNPTTVGLPTPEREILAALADAEKAAEEAAAQIHRGAECFVADCVASLRQQTAQLCEEMLESMRTGKTGVHQKTLNRLVRFIDQFKQLNFANDTVMEAQLENVKKELLTKTAEEYRDSAVARARLKNGLAQLANQARNLACQDTTELVQRFGELGRRKFNLAA